MGKYEYNGDYSNGYWFSLLANEMAEANRLKRIELDGNEISIEVDEA